MKAYLLRHAQVLVSAIGQLARHPGSTLLSTAAIGVTLALPSLLYVVLDSVHTVSGAWDGRAPASLFMKPEVTEARLEQLAADLRRRQGIESVTVTSADQALVEFRRQSGLGAAIDILDHNPLPATIVVYLDPELVGDDLGEMLAELGSQPGVDTVQSDVQWLKRLAAMLEFLRRGVLVLAVLLAFAVVVIISNTIRLAILSRRDEIEIIKLVGGSDRFVRRPFLYSGFVQGVLGAVFALVVITGALHLVAPPVNELAGLYGMEFALTGLRATDATLIVVGGGVLGWLASRLSVGRHLARIEPR